MIKTKVYLSDSQINKLKSAFKNDSEVTLQINKSLEPNNDIYLTKTQINKINEGKRITIKKSQLKWKNGGFLPLLLPALATALKFGLPALATGALSGLASRAVQKGKGIYHPFEDVKRGSGKKKLGK